MVREKVPRPKPPGSWLPGPLAACLGRLPAPRPICFGGLPGFLGPCCLSLLGLVPWLVPWVGCLPPCLAAWVLVPAPGWLPGPWLAACPSGNASPPPRRKKTHKNKITKLVLINRCPQNRF